MSIAKKKSGAATSATIAVGFSLEALLLRHTAAADAASVISHWCSEGEGSAFSWDREEGGRKKNPWRLQNTAAVTDERLSVDHHRDETQHTHRTISPVHE